MPIGWVGVCVCVCVCVCVLITFGFVNMQVGSSIPLLMLDIDTMHSPKVHVPNSLYLFIIMI
jgi:hypothetical protein